MNEYHIVTEITLYLDQLYPNIPIYVDDVAQGFEEPCFFVHVISSHYQKEPHDYVMNTVQVDVSYYPTNQKRSECIVMMEELSYNMMVLPEVHLFDKEFEIVDNVLHYTFTAKARLKRDVAAVKQQTLKVKGEIKDGEEN